MSGWWIAANIKGGAELALSPDDDKALFSDFNSCMKAIQDIVGGLDSHSWVRTKTGVVRASEILVIQAKQK